MQVGERIVKLVSWAEKHSTPRIKELGRHVSSLHQAVSDDLGRIKKLLNICTSLQLDRDEMGKISFGLCRFAFYKEPLIMTDAQYRLYASARINLLLAPLMGKELTQELKQEMWAKAEEAFLEIAAMGAHESLIENCRTNFRESLRIDPDVTELDQVKVELEVSE